MKNLFRTTFAITATEIAIIFVALVKNKYLAINIGPEGFGIYGLLQSFFAFIAVFSGSWMASGTTKYIAQYDNENDTSSVNKVYSFSISVTLFLSVTIVTILLVLQKTIINVFLDQKILKIYYILFSIAFLGNSLRPVAIALLQGLQKVKSVVLSRIFITLFDVIVVIVLVFFFDLTGFFVGILLTSVFASFFLLWQIHKESGRKFLLPGFKDFVTKNLLKFGSFNFFLVFFSFGSIYFQRFIVAKYLDLASVGLFFAGIALVRYLGIVNNGAGFLYYPNMSRTMANKTRSKQLVRYFRYILLFNIPISVFAILFGENIILLVYSKDFIQLSTTFYLFVITHFLASIGAVFMPVLLGMALLKKHAISSITGNLIKIIIILLFIQRYGFYSLGICLVTGTLVQVFMNYHFVKKKIGFNISTDVIRLLILSFITIVLSIIFKDSIVYWKLLMFLLTIISLCMFVKKEEWDKLLSFIPIINRKNL